MEKPRNGKISLNEALLERIVYSVAKGVEDDEEEYIEETRKETNNALGHLRGDNINTNLRNYMVSSGMMDIIRFKRHGWQGRLFVDRNNRIVYSVVSENTFVDLQKNYMVKEHPHYLMTLLHILNGDYIGVESQMSFEDFGIQLIDDKFFEEDFESITHGLIDRDEYTVYVVVFKAIAGQMRDISIKLLDKHFNVVDEAPLMAYVKPDFSKLTDTTTTDNKHSTIQKDMEKTNLVSLKKNVKLSILKKDETDEL